MKISLYKNKYFHLKIKKSNVFKMTNKLLFFKNSKKQLINKYYYDIKTPTFKINFPIYNKTSIKN